MRFLAFRVKRAIKFGFHSRTQRSQNRNTRAAYDNVTLLQTSVTLPERVGVGVELPVAAHDGKL